MNKYLMLLLLSVAVTYTAWAENVPDASAGTTEQLERSIIYIPRKYKPDVVERFVKAGGVRLDFNTDQGNQSAFVVLPQQGKKPERLWVICGGNATVALDWASHCRSLPFKSDAYLLIDYPGYGTCAGNPSPKGIRDNLKAAISAGCKELKIPADEIARTTCVFGHSLGCAAALIAAEEFKCKSAVLCSPFTSTPEMAHAVLGLPKDFPMTHKYDNRIGLTKLTENGGHAWIFHGKNDEVIPVAMSETLAREFAKTVTFMPVENAGHNDILEKAQQEILEAMKKARELDK